MRYARLAPLSGLTEHVQELETTNNVAKIIAAMRKDIGGTKEMFKAWDENTTQLMDVELKIANLSDRAQEYTKDPEYVINDATRICHRVLPGRLGFPVHVPVWPYATRIRFDTTFTFRTVVSPLLAAASRRAQS